MADRPVADGTVEQAPDGSTRIRFVRRLPHPIDRVWEALTDPAELDPPRFLEIAATWGTTGTRDGGTRTTLTWELEQAGDHTVLSFTNTLPIATQELTTPAGWHLHLDALERTLAGNEVDIAHPEPIFDPIHRAYEKKYGPAAAGPAVEDPQGDSGA